MSIRNLSLMAMAAGMSSGASIPVVTFDGAAGTTYKFEELNDPVMGGKSNGTWAVNATGGFGIFDGEVVDVPKLSAPGFIKASADGKFADISGALGGNIVLMVRTQTPDYPKFRLSFAAGTLSPSYACAGGGSIPLSGGCFKTTFQVPSSTDFIPVKIPIASFSDQWSPSTGEHTKECATDSSVCPTAKDLAGILRFEVWAEGADGHIHLEIQSISAEPNAFMKVAPVSARPSKGQDLCSGAVQDNLKYGISGRDQATVPVAVDDGESLAEAVCCDKRTLALAEPQFLYEAPDINLFSKMDASGVTTFFDSVCGIPVFQAPINRSLEDFQADTKEHGWPSFRPSEVIMDNVVTDKATGLVTSKCGTHLGSFLPDDEGDRWCIDLSCVAGNKA